MSAFSLIAGLLPVLMFLGAMVFIDSYKLVSRRAMIRAIVLGGAAALLSLIAHRLAVEALHVDPAMLRRGLAPVAEETLKALAIAWLIRTEKVGFMVDAAILGFAIGTGFALVENVYYAGVLGTAEPIVWIVRGLGTAVMHGSTTAVVGIVSKDFTDRHRSKALHLFLPGLAVAVTVHALFNRLVVDPLIATAALLTVMPLLLLFVYHRSERATHAWLGTGLDREVEMLEMILDGEVAATPVGDYLESVRSRFAPPVVADMLCLLRIHLELSLRAKGVMIARAAGLELPPDPEVEANLRELAYLERSIGRTGKLALLPLMSVSGTDLWQIHMLQKRVDPTRR